MIHPNLARVFATAVCAFPVVCFPQEVVPLAADPAPTASADFDSLTLPEAIRLALANNLGARVEKLQETIEDARVTGRKADFDPIFSATGLYEASEKPQNTRDFVATQSAIAPRTSRIFDEENLRFDMGLKGKTPLGTEYHFTVEMNQLKNTLNIERPPSLFYPEYESFAGVRLTQPLLRDFGPEVQYAGLRVAQIDRRQATLAWRLKVSQVVAAVVKNFYDLVFSTQDVAIKGENIKRAVELQDQNRKRVERGVGSQIDVQQAAVAASVREEELISAEYLQREKANLLLRDLVSDVDIDRIPRIRPSHRLASSVPSLARSELMREAVAHRIEYVQAQQQIEKQDIKLRFARNQLWPRVDLIGSLGANGLNSRAGSTLSDVFEGSTPAWSVGLMVSVPLGNRLARSQLKEVLTEKEQLLLNFKQLEIDLALQVDTAATRIETSGRRLATAGRSITESQATLDAELKRLEQGVGVSFNVLEAQRDVAGANSRELAARADLNKSMIDLWLATGTILDHFGIVLEDGSIPIPPPLQK